MYTAILIASYVLDYYAANNNHISNLKLQKILYFLQAQFLVNKNEPCFSDPIEAWGFGPVIPSVYKKYKVYGSAQIPHMTYSHASTFINTKDQNLINPILDELQSYSSTYLTELTMHQTPWTFAYKHHYEQISNKQILEFFKEE